MTIIKTYIGWVLTLAAWAFSLGILLLVAVPQVNADPWWYPVSMRTSQYSANRHIAALPGAAASGIAVASRVAAASGVLGMPDIAGASTVADTVAASAVAAQ